MKHENIVAVLDDGFSGPMAQLARKDEYYEESFSPLFKDYKLMMFDGAHDLVTFVTEQDAMPKVVVCDAFNGDAEGGYIQFARFAGQMKKFKTILPQHVLFASADLRYAKICKALAKKDEYPDVSFHCTETREVLVIANMIEQNWFMYSGYQDSQREFGLCNLLNSLFDMKLPTSDEELTPYLLKQGMLNEEAIVDLFEQEKINATDAIHHISTQRLWPYSRNSLEYIKDRHDSWKFAKSEFTRGNGPDKTGYAAFTLEQARTLRAQGKEPILIVNEFSPEWYPHIPELGGIVSLNETMPGHLLFIAEACKVPVIVGAKSDSKVNLSTLPDLTRYTAPKDGKKSNPPMDLGFGDKVTVEPADARDRSNLWQGHMAFSEASHRDEVYKIPQIYDAYMAEGKNRKQMAFLSTVNGPEQIRDAVRESDNGIGLIRTENLVYADADQLRMVRELVLSPTPDKNTLNTFYSVHYTSAQSFFNRFLKDLVRREKPSHKRNFSRHYAESSLSKLPPSYPITVRLMDIPLDELLPPEDLHKVDMSVPSLWRGMNMAQRKPQLYFKHIKAVFRAYGNMLNSIGTRAYCPKELKDKFKLNVLLPNVTSASNVHFARMFIHKIHANVADRFEYNLGAMIENKRAVANIEDIAPNVSFISIGSNDLSAAFLGVSRSELLNLKAKGGKTTYAVTLHPAVKEVILDVTTRARKANPDIHISLCGAHAQDLKSLRDLRPAKLDSISVTPTTRNHIALYADWGLYDARKRGHWPAPKKPIKKAETREIIDVISDLPTLV